jgi:hypothetical protein
MAAEGLYARMFKAQAAWYVREEKGEKEEQLKQ